MKYVNFFKVSDQNEMEKIFCADSSVLFSINFLFGIPMIFTQLDKKPIYHKTVRLVASGLQCNFDKNHLNIVTSRSL